MSNIYDDVALLQEQVVSTGKDRTEVTATVSIYYTVN